MTLNKKQTRSTIKKSVYLIGLIIFSYSFIISQLLAQENNKLNEIEINRTTNLDGEDDLDLPTNPFEIVDRIRRANSMNEATEPSEAIDDALETFDKIKNENQIWFPNGVVKFLVEKF